MKNMVVDRYKFTPHEASEFIEAYGEGQKALEGAILNAGERTRIYSMIAQWEATWLPDGGILVKRYRHKKEVSIRHFGVEQCTRLRR
jgi:hypothetical protein